MAGVMSTTLTIARTGFTLNNAGEILHNAVVAYPVALSASLVLSSLVRRLVNLLTEAPDRSNDDSPTPKD